MSRRARRALCRSLPSPGEECILPVDTSHHLLHVLRVPRGHVIRLFDGDGAEADVTLTNVVGGRAVVCRAPDPSDASDPIFQPEDAPPGPADRCVAFPPGPALLLLPSLVKGPAFERILRMATELGATEIRPVLTARSGPRGEPLERWTRILASAATQCGRAELPLLTPASPLETRLREPLPDLRLVFVPGGPVPVLLPDAPRALLVGPEGGFTDDEIAACRAAGFQPAGLGPWILRADTAVAAALARYGM